MFIKPSNSLQKGLLSAKLLGLNAQIASHGKAVRNSAEQIDLKGLFRPDQNGLRLMAQFRGEYGVCLSRGNREWPSNRSQLLVGYEANV